jgi:hypothetical protein
MKEFDFIRTYIAGLPEAVRNDRYLGYVLREGKDETEICQLEQAVGISVPHELREFYQFSFGALLGEYEMLTISEIANTLPMIRPTDERYHKDSILPFAYVRGVGDVVAFDLDQSNEDGLLLILDGFHELPPVEWEGICYGLRTWLVKMVENHFRPFWLAQRSLNDDGGVREV